MGGNQSTQKTSWPELVGMAATPASTKITQDRPDVAVEVIPPGGEDQLSNDGVNPKRVRVFIDDAGAVDKIPSVG